MPTEDTPPNRKRMTSEMKGYTTDSVSISVAREVLRRVRESGYACPDIEANHPKNSPDNPN